MEISSHYYAVLNLCFALGYNKDSALTIAHASQFVDDANTNTIYLKNRPARGIDCTKVKDKYYFFNMSTCHAYTKIKTFNWHSMTGNTSAFHFVPALQGNTFTKKMRCKENSPVMDEIIKLALKENDPLKLGMVLHPLADTFSHQGFSGILSNENDINNLTYAKGTFNFLTDAFRWLGSFINEDILFDRVAPAYGHSQALTIPDIPYQVWSYTYDQSDSFSGQTADSGRISNSERYKRAFIKMTGLLTTFLKKYPGHGSYSGFPLEKSFYDILAEKSSNGAKIRKWQKFSVKNGWLSKGEEGYKYDNEKWAREAFSNYNSKEFSQRVVYDALLNPGFADSSWYRYYKAVLWYKDIFFRIAEKHKLKIPQ